MEEFATEASKAVPPFQSIYLSQDDEIIKPLFAKVAPDIQGTVDTYYVKRSFNSTEVCFLEFYRSSKDLEPFHVQHYPFQVQKATKVGVVFVRNFIMKMKSHFSVLFVRYGFMENVLENTFSANVKDMWLKFKC